MTEYSTAFRGTLAQGTLAEIFSHSLSVDSTMEPNMLAQTMWDVWETEWNNPTTGLGVYFPPIVSYAEVVVASILNLTDDPDNPDDGKLSAATHYQGGPLPGLALPGAVMPSQNAVAVSLSGGRYPNGATPKSRFYLPGVATSFLDPTDGRLTSAARDGIAFSIHRYLANIKNTGIVPSIWSRWAPKHGQATGQFYEVDMVRVGDRVDTVRRRRNSAPEVYSLQPLA